MEVGAVLAAPPGLSATSNGSVETGVGNLANIQLAAASPAVTLSCVVPVSTPAEAQQRSDRGIYYRDDLLVAPMRLADARSKFGRAGHGHRRRSEENRTYRVRGLIARHAAVGRPSDMRKEILERQAKAMQAQGLDAIGFLLAGKTSLTRPASSCRRSR